MPTLQPAYRLTLYAPRSIDPNEATVLTPVAGASHSDPFQVTTLQNIVGWKPYLQMPTGRSGRLDALTKRTDIGVMTFRVLNPQIGATKATRWLDAFLGDLKGRLRGGGLKAFGEESLDGGTTWTPFWTGRVRQIKDDVVAVDLRIRELGDDLLALAFVGRPHPDVTYAGLPIVLPVGAVPVAYGTLPAVKPLTGICGAAFYANLSRVLLDSASVGRGDNLITTNLLRYAETWHLNLGQSPLGARVRLTRLDTLATGLFKVPLFERAPKSGGHESASAVYLQALETTEIGYLPLPPNGTAVAFWIEIEPPFSSESPLVIGDVHPVTLWKHLLEGKFGYHWMAPEILPPGKSYGDPRLPIPYDATKFATLEADPTLPNVRFLVKGREKRGEWITKHLLPAAHLGFYFDATGTLVPVDLRLPSDVSGVPTITDADLLAVPDWDYDRGRAVTRVDGAYYQDFPAKAVDFMAAAEKFPTIQEGGLKALRYPVTIIDLGNSDLGDSPHALDLEGFRFMEGETLQGQPRAQYLDSQLRKLALETARPFGFGAPELGLVCVRGSVGDTRPGELRKVAAAAVIDPANPGQRGGERLIRVSGREERGPGIAIRSDDLGSTAAAAVPMLGAPAQEIGNTKNGVTLTVTLNAAGDPVELHFAVTATSVGTAPTATSPLWVPRTSALGTPLIKSTGSWNIRQIPAGSRIWVRGRSLPVGAQGQYRLPSAWVAAAAPGYVDSAGLAAPSAPASSSITARTFRVSWTNGSADLDTELLLATPTSDPRVVVARIPKGSVLYDFPGGTGLDLQPSTTYRIGIRHAQSSPASVSAEVTLDVTTTASLTIVRPPRLIPIMSRLI